MSVKDPILYYQDQIELWQEEMDSEKCEESRNACRILRDEAARLNAQFQRIAYAYLSEGPGLTLKSEYGHCVVLPDATEPGRFRYQCFNQTGFTGHTTRDTVEQVLLEAFRDGYRNIEFDDVLSKFCATKEWEKGSLLNDLVRQINCGDLTHKEADQLYEEGLAKIDERHPDSRTEAA